MISTRAGLGLSLFLSAILAVGCGESSRTAAPQPTPLPRAAAAPHGTGTLTLSISWPEAPELKAKVIPTSTQNLRFTVTGTGVATYTHTAARQGTGTQTVTLEGVPTGTGLSLLTEALNTSDAVVANNTSAINVATGTQSVSVALAATNPPVISGVSPGSASWGTSVTITGTVFGGTQGASTVKFNGTAATPSTWSATSITVPVPNGSSTGNIVVRVDGVDSAGYAFTVNPSITGLSPTSGPVGSSLTISGGNFGATQGTSTVSVGGSAATGTSWSDTAVTVTVPAGLSTGAKTVQVTVGGVASSTQSFTVTPGISSLSVTTGSYGTSVTITGTNFSATPSNNSVTFNGTSAAVTSATATSISTSVPVNATTGNVVVTVGGLASNGQSFTIPTPSITSLSLTCAAVGTSVTVTGTNFGSTQGSSTLKFNGTTATPSAWSNTSITAPVPSGATTGNAVVTLAGSNASNGVSLPIYSTSVCVGSVNPASGSAGTSVTIKGNGFGATQGTSTVKFNGLSAGAATTWSATQIVIPVPVDATTGAATVTVGGTQSNSNQTFTVPAPAISSLSPVCGAANTSVTITGTNFGSTRGTSTVKFNGTSVSTYTSWSNTSLLVKVPTGATTGNSVVRVSGQDSNGSTFSVSSACITGISPTSGSVGTSVTISGSGFGNSRGTSTVTFNGTAATTYTSWSSTSIQATVPSGATTGPVKVNVGSNTSNGITFTVQ